MKSFLFESSFFRESKEAFRWRKDFHKYRFYFRNEIQRKNRNTRSLPKLMKLIFQIQIKTNDHNPNFWKGAKERKKRGGRSRNRSSDFLFFWKSIPSNQTDRMIRRFRKSVFHLGAGDPGDQRDSCLKNAGRFIQSSRADNAHEAGDRSLSAYLMLVQQRRRVCVEAHIDCHPCRHPSPLLHHRCPSPPPHLPSPRTPRHPVRPARCIERATTFHRIYRSTEAPVQRGLVGRYTSN